MLPIARHFVFIVFMLLSTTTRSEPLDQAGVQHFVDSMRVLQAREAYFEDFMEAWQSGAGATGQPGSLMPSSLVALMADREGHQTLDQVARDHDFNDAEAWGKTGDRILLAVLNLAMGENAPAMQRELAQMEREIRDNPRFSDQHKERMGRMVQSSSDLMERVSGVTETDREAVRPHLGELRDVLGYSPES